ncbi:MAG: HAD-superfamily hydrolase, subfamily variant 1 [Firmicutes bacterium]|nr:HAD-superfamily hydrolase, subfamily variant 1 [Bacillota bacterium]
MSYDIILFDLDGTLTDSKPGIIKSVQYALDKCGIYEPDLDKLIPFIGPPLLESFQEFYSMERPQAEQAIGYYREYFSKTGIYENAVYPEIIELLASLTNCGKRLIMATSKPAVFATQIAKYFALEQYFTTIVGSNLDGTLTSKTEVVACALSAVSDKLRRRSVMVGDRKYDIIGAQSNHIDSIGVEYGYGTSEELSLANPTHLVANVDELKQLLVK